MRVPKPGQLNANRVLHETREVMVVAVPLAVDVAPEAEAVSIRCNSIATATVKSAGMKRQNK